MTKKFRGKKVLSRGIRAYIRREKARIRREVLDPLEQEYLIKELLDRIGRGRSG